MKPLDRLIIALIAAIGFSTPTIGAFALPDEFREVVRQSATSDSASIPLGRFEDGSIPMQTIDGEVENIILRVEGTLPTLDLLREVAAHFTELGYREIFRCHDRKCGGFDFVSEIDIVSAPDMYVDIGNFRYMSARREAGGKADLVGVIVSRSMHAGFIQVTAAKETMHSLDLYIDTAEAIVRSVNPDSEIESSSRNSLSVQLAANGHAVLQTLEFAPGSLNLANGELHELEELAEYLKAHSNHMVILVGHTDTRGTLESNVDLSRQRAEAVQKLLIERYGADPQQLMAEGIGYLSPRATNTTEEGRARNRRVEAILVAIE